MNDTMQHKLATPKEPTPTLAELAADMEFQKIVLKQAKEQTAAAHVTEYKAAMASKAADRAFNDAVNALKTKRPRTAKQGEQP